MTINEKKRAGNKLKELRLAEGMSRREVAEKVGMSQSTVQAAEEGWRGAGESAYEKIAKSFGFDLSSLSIDRLPLCVVLDKGAYMPTRAHETDAGYDLRTPKTDMISAGGSLVIDTGVHIAIPEGYAGVICSKSGLNVKHGIISDGLIDSGYTGSIRVKLYNLSDKAYIFEAGDKISQIMFIPILTATLLETLALKETERGDGGFGSTGR